MSNKYKVSAYLNYAGNAEEAFEFYKTVFNVESSHPVMRFKNLPPAPNHPAIPESVADKIMHAELEIFDGFKLMFSDALPEMGHNVVVGNNLYLSLEPSSKEDTEKLFKALSEGGVVRQNLQETFWGAYYAEFSDKFGVKWMINFPLNA